MSISIEFEWQGTPATVVLEDDDRELDPTRVDPVAEQILVGGLDIQPWLTARQCSQIAIAAVRHRINTALQEDDGPLPRARRLEYLQMNECLDRRMRFLSKAQSKEEVVA